jgi:hypothetical protein
MSALGLGPGSIIYVEVAGGGRRDAGPLPAPIATAPAPPVIKADLSRANLNQANLERAGMVAANMQDANLTQVCAGCPTKTPLLSSSRTNQLKYFLSSLNTPKPYKMTELLHPFESEIPKSSLNRLQYTAM